MTSDDEIGVVPSVLNFSYKFLVKKHVSDIVLPVISLIGKTGLDFDEEMINIDPLSRPVRSHFLNALIHEAKSLQEIITPSTTRKTMCEGIIKMLTPHFTEACSTWPAIPGNKSDITHID